MLNYQDIKAEFEKNKEEQRKNNAKLNSLYEQEKHERYLLRKQEDESKIPRFLSEIKERLSKHGKVTCIQVRNNLKRCVYIVKEGYHVDIHDLKSMHNIRLLSSDVFITNEIFRSLNLKAQGFHIVTVSCKCMEHKIRHNVKKITISLV